MNNKIYLIDSQEPGGYPSVNKEDILLLSDNTVKKLSDFANDGNGVSNQPFITAQDLPTYDLDAIEGEPYKFSLTLDGTPTGNIIDLEPYLDNTDKFPTAIAVTNTQTGEVTVTFNDDSTITGDFSSLLGGGGGTSELTVNTVDDLRSLTGLTEGVIYNVKSHGSKEIIEKSVNDRTDLTAQEKIDMIAKFKATAIQSQFGGGTFIYRTTPYFTANDAYASAGNNVSVGSKRVLGIFGMNPSNNMLVCEKGWGTNLITENGDVFFIRNTTNNDTRIDIDGTRISGQTPIPEGSTEITKFLNCGQIGEAGYVEFADVIDHTIQNGDKFFPLDDDGTIINVTDINGNVIGYFERILNEKYVTPMMYGGIPYITPNQISYKGLEESDIINTDDYIFNDLFKESKISSYLALQRCVDNIKYASKVPLGFYYTDKTVLVEIDKQIIMDNVDGEAFDSEFWGLGIGCIFTDKNINVIQCNGVNLNGSNFNVDTSQADMYYRVGVSVNTRNFSSSRFRGVSISYFGNKTKYVYPEYNGGIGFALDDRIGTSITRKTPDGENTGTFHYSDVKIRFAHTFAGFWLFDSDRYTKEYGDLAPSSTPLSDADLIQALVDKINSEFKSEFIEPDLIRAPDSPRTIIVVENGSAGEVQMKFVGETGEYGSNGITAQITDFEIREDLLRRLSVNGLQLDIQDSSNTKKFCIYERTVSNSMFLTRTYQMTYNLSWEQAISKDNPAVEIAGYVYIDGMIMDAANPPTEDPRIQIDVTSTTGVTIQEKIVNKINESLTPITLNNSESDIWATDNGERFFAKLDFTLVYTDVSRVGNVFTKIGHGYRVNDILEFREGNNVVSGTVTNVTADTFTCSGTFTSLTENSATIRTEFYIPEGNYGDGLLQLADSHIEMKDTYNLYRNRYLIKATSDECRMGPALRRFFKTSAKGRYINLENFTGDFPEYALEYSPIISPRSSTPYNEPVKLSSLTNALSYFPKEGSVVLKSYDGSNLEVDIESILTASSLDNRVIEIQDSNIVELTSPEHAFYNDSVGETTITTKPDYNKDTHYTELVMTGIFNVGATLFMAFSGTPKKIQVLSDGVQTDLISFPGNFNTGLEKIYRLNIGDIGGSRTVIIRFIGVFDTKNKLTTFSIHNIIGYAKQNASRRLPYLTRTGGQTMYGGLTTTINNPITDFTSKIQGFSTKFNADIYAIYYLNRRPHFITVEGSNIREDSRIVLDKDIQTLASQPIYGALTSIEIMTSLKRLVGRFDNAYIPKVNSLNDILFNSSTFFNGGANSEKVVDPFFSPGSQVRHGIFIGGFTTGDGTLISFVKDNSMIIQDVDASAQEVIGTPRFVWDTLRFTKAQYDSFIATASGSVVEVLTATPVTAKASAIYLIDASGGGQSFAFPTPTGDLRPKIYVQKTDSSENAVFLSNVLGGYNLELEGEYATFVWDGSAWVLLYNNKQSKDVYSDVDKTATETLNTRSERIVIDSSGGAVTLTLSTSVGNEGVKKKFIVYDATNTVTIDTTSSQEIRESVSSTATSKVLIEGDILEVISKGTYWQVI